MLYTTLKIASGYGTQYHNNLIPKNALYGRITKYIFVYISDFRIYTRSVKKHKEKVNQAYFKIHIMDTQKSSKFIDSLCVEGCDLFDTIWNTLENNNHWDAQIEYCYNFKRDQFNSCIRKNKGMKGQAFSEKTRKNRGEIPLEFHEAIMAHVYITKNQTRGLPQNI